jgi:trehalose-phosphatase
MKQLAKNKKHIREAIKRHEHVLLLLDYDGTLTPIVSRPELAKLSGGTKKLVTNLVKNLFFTVAVISGRSLKDVKNLIGIKGIVYAGNHGLEIEGPKIKFANPAAQDAKPLLKDISKKLKSELSDIEGALVEDKGLSLSIHFRLVKTRDLIKLRAVLNRTLRPWRLKKKIRLTYGKKIYEVRPPVKWDKGKATKLLYARTERLHPKTIPIFIGDDKTDEDAFKALKGKGISVFVGSYKALSRAEYNLKNVKAVGDFLRYLNGIKFN